VLPLRRIELAQWIGTAPETLSRTLHEMERRGWIELDRTHIAVRDRGRLLRVAVGGRAGR
jgi:CRP-like cAMP-binding protein